MELIKSLVMGVASLLTMLGGSWITNLTSNEKWIKKRKLIWALYVINIIAIWVCILVIILPL